MRRCLFLCIAVACTHFLPAQSVSPLIGAEANGMGYATSCLANNWSLFNNIGGLSRVESTQIFAACDIPPVLPGARRVALGAAIPLSFTVAGLGAYRFGDDIYHEQLVSLGFSNRLGLASLGLKVNYVEYRAEGFGTRSAISICFGGIAWLTDKLSVGAYMTNLNQAHLENRAGEKLPTSMAVGIGMQPSEKVFLTGEAGKDLDQEMIWRAGASYAPSSRIVFRTGFNLNPDTAFIGLGFHVSRVRLDYAFQYSPPVFYSHQASICYQFRTE